MAAQGKVIITGLREIDRKLHTLPLRIQKKVASRAVRAGMKLVARAIRQLAPVLSGVLKANIVVRMGLYRKRGQVSVDARIDANDRTKKTSARTGKTVFYPAIVEYKFNDYMLRAFKIAAEPARRATIAMLKSGIDQEVSKG